MTHDRRTFLRGAGLAGTALAIGLARPVVAADSTVFRHGVASGDPTPDRVVLWTRVTGRGTVPVRWRVARDSAFADIVRAGTAHARPDADHTVKVDVGGLEPGTWYFYDFRAGGVSSVTGRTKTAPAGKVEHLRFGVVSCSNYQAGYFNAYARLADRDDLDAVIHLGDYLYEYGNGEDRYGEARDHVPAHEMVSLGDYRARHAQYKTDPDLQRLHQLFPFIVTWDDHESANNAWREGAENHTAGTEGAWADRKAAATRAYSEWMPIRTGDPAVIYRNLPYGELAEIVVLDTRLDGRDPEVGTVGMTLTSGGIDAPDRKLVSDRQRAFVLDRLHRTASTWKVLAQQVILAQWNAGGLPRAAVNMGPLRNGGNALNPDQWDGYTAERDRVFGHIRAKGINDVVVLTGDVHTSWANDLVEDPYDPLRYNPVTGAGALGVEFVTPSVTSANFAALGPVGVRAFEAATRADNPHVKFVNFERHGYLVLDLTPERAQADWFFVDTVTRTSTGEQFGAAWQVRRGENHVQAASAAAPGGRKAPPLAWRRRA